MIDFLKMVNISDSTLIEMMKNNNERYYLIYHVMKMML